jgi:hypothetical protein
LVRPGSDKLKEALKGSHSTRLIVDAFYGNDRTMMNVPVTDWNLSWDSEAQTKAVGSVTIAYSSDVAESMTPRKFVDTFAPFGQQLSILMEVTAGGSFRETVSLGWYRITGVPDARDEYFELLGRTMVVGSTIKLELDDRMVSIERDGFRSEQNPVLTDSCWGEIARLTGMVVQRSLPDKRIPESVVYPAAQGGRLKAVQELAGVLGGVAYVTPDGALSVLPDKAGPVVSELTLGDEGTILDVAYSFASNEVYNEVVGNFEDDDRNPINAYAAITDGPLSVFGPYGKYTRYYSSQFVKTQQQADDAVRTVLGQVSEGRTYRVPVTCIADPLLEDGDVVSLERPDGTELVGRIVSHTLSSNGPMELELEVTRSYA